MNSAMQHINLSAISWKMFKKPQILKSSCNQNWSLMPRKGLGGWDLLLAMNWWSTRPPLYSCIDRIRLNDCNLYFIRWISALYYTGGDNRLNMGSSTGAAESFLVSFFLFVMMMVMMMMMKMKKGNLPFTSSISRGNVRAQQHDNINGPGHLFSMIFILGPLYWS